MKDLFQLYNASEEGLNKDLMMRKYDKPLVDYLINIAKSLDTIINIEFIDYELEKDESKINVSKYILERKRSKPKFSFNYRYLKYTRYEELKLRFMLKARDGSEVITKSLLVPKVDRNGYMTIADKKYFFLYQLVDKSTYTTQGALILKSCIAVTMNRKSQTYKEMGTEEEFSGPIYRVRMYKLEINVLLLYFAKIGVPKTLKYFSCDLLIRFLPDVEDDESKIYFRVNQNLVIEVAREMFIKHEYVRSIAFMLIETCDSRTRVETMYEITPWVEKLGMYTTTSKNNAYGKGLKQLMNFESMVDINTLELLRLDPINKKHIYSVVRWMIQHYSTLRKKSNMDLDNKRLRLYEYVASAFSTELKRRVNQFIKNDKATLSDLKNIFKFPSDLLVQNLYSSGLMRVDDAVNDCDFFTKYRYTIKGPQCIGGSNERNIIIGLRDIDLSHLGRLDINVCGNTDPGTSGVITPFCKDIVGMEFSDKPEPQDFLYKFSNDLNDYLDKIDDRSVTIHYGDQDSYYEIQKRFQDTNKKILMSDIYTLDDDEFFIGICIPEKPF